MSEAQIKKTGKREKAKEEERKDMMNFETFVEFIEKEIGNWLPESFRNAEISIERVKKTNDVERVGLMIRTDKNIAPNIYLEELYNMYLHGRSIRDILEEIVELRVELEQKNDINTDELLDFKKCMNRVLPQLVSAEWNQEQLNLRPHVLIEDLAVVFYVHLQDGPDGEANMKITNQHLELWETTTDELYETALKNLSNLKTGVFKSINDAMMELINPIHQCQVQKDHEYDICKPMEEDKMFIVSNMKKVNGSSELLDRFFMNKIVDLLGCDFYILPSSIHECIIVPLNEDITLNALKKMVVEVNESQVTEEERLSNSVYTYSVDDGLKLA